MRSDNQSLQDVGQLPPIRELLRGRPTSWQGMAISWSSESDPVPVFLARLRTGKGANAVDAFFFGARYDLSEALLDGQALGDGYFVEYFVVCARREGGWDLHRLLQRRSVTFSENEDSKDYVPATTVRVVRDRSAETDPRWESASEAVWPTNRGEPMSFLGQVHLPESKSTRTTFTWGTTVYLFWQPNGRGVFKAVTQPCGEQTPEQHYESEA